MSSEPDRLERTLAQLPDLPGVYQMIAADGRILYIGKAVSLRNRVRSYFQESAAHPYRTVKMVERVADVRTIVVTNEVEALILEANLIKRHQPPFNVRLRDDKRFPYLKVTNERFPRVTFNPGREGRRRAVFRPYTNAHGLRELIDLVRMVFPLRNLPRADRRETQAPVPAVPHQALSGAVRRLSVRGGLRQTGRRGRALSRRALRPADRAAAARDDRCRRALQLRGCGPVARPDHRGATHDRRTESRLAFADRTPT